MKIFIGIVIGVVLAKLYTRLKKYLKRKGLRIDWKNIVIFLVIIYLIYSFIGIIVSPEYTKQNGNVCKGFDYGIQICSGDINAE